MRYNRCIRVTVFRHLKQLSDAFLVQLLESAPKSALIYKPRLRLKVDLITRTKLSV